MNPGDVPDMDAVAIGVASITGMKKQFVDAGWSERGAEEITVAMFYQSKGR